MRFLVIAVVEHEGKDDGDKKNAVHKHNVMMRMIKN
jgi:hypothetical protein